MERTVIVDVDGTLVDTNYHHVLAWARAFHEHGHSPPLWRIHRSMGMGGDKVAAHLAGDEVEERQGDGIRAAESRCYGALIDEVQLFAGARELLADLRAAGLCVILASSAKQEELDHYLDLLDARGIVDGWTSAADVDATKPDPDLIHAALERAGAGEAVMVGDTPWDVRAARSADVPTVCVMTGGFSGDELAEAGATAVFESVEALRDQLRDGVDSLSRPAAARD